MLPMCEKRSVYEVVLFTVKESQRATFLETNRTVLEKLSRCKGFQKSNTYQSSVESSKYIDIVAWDSMEDAEQAAAQFTSEAAFLPYMEAIEEVLHSFHLTAVSDGFLGYEPCSDDDVLEFALFSIREGSEEAYLNERVAAMEHVHESYPGFRGILTLQDPKNSTQFLDLPIWKSTELAHRAQKELMEDEAFCRIMQYIDMEKPLLVENFRKVR